MTRFTANWWKNDSKDGDAINAKGTGLIFLWQKNSDVGRFHPKLFGRGRSPSAFLYAGSPNVVSSLWAVNDISTALLMIKFYENLQESSSVAVALNQAQRWLRDSTGDALQQWIKERPLHQLLMGQTLKLQLQRHIQEKMKPFQEQFYWAVFCGVGQSN